MTDPLKASLLTSEERLLAAIVYGESSTLDQYEEMAALASVMVRQMKSRGYWTIQAFTSKDRNFSFVHTDGNARYARLMRASETDIARSTAMSDAVNAARNAFAGGPDYPKGAYFWDGADIKSNYARHAKVRSGIHISDPAHNVYGISDSGTTRILYRTVRKRVNGRSGPSNSKWDDICGCMNLRLASGEQFSGAMGATGFELPEQRNTNDASDCFHGFMGAMPDGPSRASIRSGHGRLPLVRQGGTIDQRDPV